MFIEVWMEIYGYKILEKITEPQWKYKVSCERWHIFEMRQFCIYEGWNYCNECKKIELIPKNRLYRVYQSMMARCKCIKSKSYKYYGWRWIKSEWNTFEEFYEDMYKWYKEWLQIDRIDNNGNYSKKNCRWVTAKENNRNRRSNVLYKWKCVLDWCNELWLNNRTVYWRIRKWKWDIEKALFTPTKKYKKLSNNL